MIDDIPIPFPGNEVARELLGGGWVATRPGRPVRWTGERADGCCGSLIPPDSRWPFTCTRGLGHTSRWHIAGLSDTKAVAVWWTS